MSAMVVLGSVGLVATVGFLGKTVQHTPVTCDQ